MNKKRSNNTEPANKRASERIKIKFMAKAVPTTTININNINNNNSNNIIIFYGS